MEEETYYFNPERERQHYPEIPPEHTENYVLGSYYIEQYVRDWHEQAAQQRALEPTQGYPMYEFEHHAPSLIDPELEPRSEEDAVVIKQEGEASLLNYHLLFHTDERQYLKKMVSASHLSQKKILMKKVRKPHTTIFY